MKSTMIKAKTREAIVAYQTQAFLTFYGIARNPVEQEKIKSDEQQNTTFFHQHQ